MAHLVLVSPPASPPAEGSPLDAASPTRDGLPRDVWVALAVVALGSILALASADPGARALRALPAAERAALFERTRANVGTLCTGAPGLRDACAEQTRLLLSLPDCDGACRNAVAALRPGPTR